MILRVSILAPRVRGAHHLREPTSRDGVKFQSSPPEFGGRIQDRREGWRRRKGERFNPRPPSSGGASHAPGGMLVHRSSFNPRPPSSGGASPSSPTSFSGQYRFNPRPPSSGGASVSWATNSAERTVSILAPRVRGAHPFARNRLISQNFRPTLREPTLELFPANPSVSQLTFASLKNQLLTSRANLTAISPPLHVRAAGYSTPPVDLRNPLP